MRLRVLLIGLAFAILFFGFFLFKDIGEYANPKRAYTKDEREDLVASAGRGDVGAAWRLYQYYSLVDYEPGQREKWLLVGAKYGDQRSIFSLAMMYANVDSQRFDLKKSSQWADVLEKSDPEEAKKVRREIERVRKHEDSK